jgi:hypothetical protein
VERKNSLTDGKSDQVQALGIDFQSRIDGIDAAITFDYQPLL